MRLKFDKIHSAVKLKNLDSLMHVQKKKKGTVAHQQLYDLKGHAVSGFPYMEIFQEQNTFRLRNNWISVYR